MPVDVLNMYLQAKFKQHINRYKRDIYITALLRVMAMGQTFSEYPKYHEYINNTQEIEKTGDEILSDLLDRLEG